jgi:hypothetical protein
MEVRIGAWLLTLDSRLLTPMDERERDKFYSPPEVTPDDEEYELEAPDPAILSAEKRHAQEVAEQVRASIDIDEIYRDAERSRGTEIIENWVRNFQYRFQVKHLLIATAVVAMALALAKLGYLLPTLVILLVGSIVGLYSYLNWEERKQQAEAYQKRQELYAKRREQLQSKGMSPAGIEPQPNRPMPAPNAPPACETQDMWEEPAAPEPVRIQFSLRSLLIAMTIAAVSLGMIRVLGGPGPTATILGLIAVAGLVIHAIGFEPPQSVILGWWFVLVLYVVLSIVGAV